MELRDRPLVIVRGGGDLGSGTAHRLRVAGFRVVVLEREAPTLIRRTVSFGSAVFSGRIEVEGIAARRVAGAGEALDAAGAGEIPVLVDPAASEVRTLEPSGLVDAILAKKAGGTRRGDAPVVIGLGPGFEAGVDVDAVVETMRGHRLGRSIYLGRAADDTGVPGLVGGAAGDRVLRAPAAGTLEAERRIGEIVARGERIGRVGGVDVLAGTAGVIRGLLWDGVAVPAGTKIGDIDPRGDASVIDEISDKARAVAGGVLEAFLRFRDRWEGRPSR